MTQKKSTSSSSAKKAHAATPASAPKSKPTRGASAPPPAALPTRGKTPKAGIARTAPFGRLGPLGQPIPLPQPPSDKPVVPFKPRKLKPGEHPTLEELCAYPTENIWAFYRKATAHKPRDEAWLEQLRNVLMEMHYALVKHIAERLLQTLPKSIELDDLISAGLFGLMDAIRGFDPDRGIKFKTYCTTRIRGSILDQLRSQDWVPRLVRLKAGRIDKAFQKLRGEYGREPTHAELATYLKMDHEELITEIDESRARQITSINERWNEHDDDSSMEKIDIVEDPTSVDPIKEMNKRDMLKYITRSLTHKEQFIIEQYYQIGHTMREIGEMLALTESRVCQIHSNVMSRLKALLGPKSE